MSNELINELSSIQQRKAAANAERLEELVRSVAHGESVEAATAAEILDRNGIDTTELQRRLALMKKRISWAHNCEARRLAEPQIEKLTAEIDRLNDEKISEYNARDKHIRELLDQRREAEGRLNVCEEAERNLRETFTGRVRLGDLRKRLNNGEFATALERQSIEAEIESLESAELLP
jgi:hypothetical protein